MPVGSAGRLNCCENYSLIKYNTNRYHKEELSIKALVKCPDCGYELKAQAYVVITIYEEIRKEVFRNMEYSKILEKRNILEQGKHTIDKVTISSYEKDFELTFTHNSTAIEGNTLTLMEAKVVLEDGISIGGKELREIYEVVNHKKAYRYIKSCIAEKKQLNENIVKDIHTILTENIIVGGIYRNQEVRMSGAGHTPPTGNNMYHQIKNFYADLVWKRKELNPIELAAWTHAEFVRIHPFIDGNVTLRHQQKAA